jgi:large subunit ribosomal protein L10
VIKLGKIAVEKALKYKVVEELKQVFADTGIVIITQNAGLTVKDARALRRKIKDSQSSFRVAKNSLVKLALEGSKYQELSKFMTGPTAIAYSHDPVAAAKAIDGFAKENEKLKVSGAVMGDVFLTPAQVKQLADLPSLDQLRGKIIGLLQAPASKIAAVLQAPGAQLARVVDAHAKNNQ